MPDQESEQARLQRIRANQLRDRDPRARDRALHQHLAARNRRKPFTLKSIIADFQSKWLWMLCGAIIGLALGVVLVYVVQATWTEIIAYVLVFAGAVIGRVLGSVMDWRHDDWERK